jgi:spore maturation protein CgeB
MRFVLFYHSFVSCWNHGNAHFLRGICRELLALGHEVAVYEPEDGWSRLNAIRDDGAAALREAAVLVPGIKLLFYDAKTIDLDRTLDGADVVLVHEWNEPELVGAIGRHRSGDGRYALLFHDTHHRAVSAAEDMRRYRIEHYDGVLTFGETLREVYLRNGWAWRVFTWHEAADTALFRPLPDREKDTDLVWIGNWGDGERAEELQAFLIEPVAGSGHRLRIHGVRYPDDVRRKLAENAIDYAGWLPNHEAPEIFARARLTLHVPRRHYVEMLPGIPTIRVFEALACGIPLICAPWRDEESLFPAGAYLSVSNSRQMAGAIAAVIHDEDLRAALVRTGLHAIHARHSCGHRVRELLGIVSRLTSEKAPRPASPLQQTQRIAA